jgi:uncharacterized RDD family membrane protein YckC
MSWYYAENGVQKGPIQNEEFQSLVQAGTVRAETLVWREGMADWKSYGQIVAAAQAPAAPPVAAAGTGLADTGVCAECHGAFSRKDMVAYGDKLVCANCRDAFFQKVREGVATGAAMVYGGFWIRFLAKFIDTLLLMAVNFLIQIPYMILVIPMASAMEQGGTATVGFILLNLLLVIFQVTITIGYSVFFIGRFAATPGKMAVSLKVVKADGGKVSYLRALGRGCSEILSGMILYIGYIMAGFDDEKRTLHDRICDTRVIKTR